MSIILTNEGVISALADRNVVLRTENDKLKAAFEPLNALLVEQQAQIDNLIAANNELRALNDDLRINNAVLQTRLGIYYERNSS